MWGSYSFSWVHNLSLLHHIQHLFFDLLQFVFHLYHDFLHFSVVRFTAECIDLPSHFLSDETELLALSVAAFQRADEIFQVVGEALFFLVDIQFFDVVNQFLFQTILVRVQRLFECVGDTFLDFLHPFFFVRSYLFEQQCDVSYLFAELLFQCGAFLFAEVYQMTDCFENGGTYHFPFFFRQLLDFSLRHNVRHTEQRLKPVGGDGDAEIFRDRLNLFVVAFHQHLVDRSRAFRTLFFLYPEAEVHLSTFQHFGDFVADFDLLLVSPELEGKAREICGKDASLSPVSNPETGIGANPVYGMQYMVVGGGGIGFSGGKWAVADRALLSEVFKLVYITEPSVLVSPRENPLVTDYIAYIDFAFGFGDARPIIFSNPTT